jgi:hypothetical protein
MVKTQIQGILIWFSCTLLLLVCIRHFCRTTEGFVPQSCDSLDALDIRPCCVNDGDVAESTSNECPAGWTQQPNSCTGEYNETCVGYPQDLKFDTCPEGAPEDEAGGAEDEAGGADPDGTDPDGTDPDGTDPDGTITPSNVCCQKYGIGFKAEGNACPSGSELPQETCESMANLCPNTGYKVADLNHCAIITNDNCCSRDSREGQMVGTQCPENWGNSMQCSNELDLSTSSICPVSTGASARTIRLSGSLPCPNPDRCCSKNVNGTDYNGKLKDGLFGACATTDGWADASCGTQYVTCTNQGLLNTMTYSTCPQVAPVAPMKCCSRRVYGETTIFKVPSNNQCRDIPDATDSTSCTGNYSESCTGTVAMVKDPRDCQKLTAPVNPPVNPATDTCTSTDSTCLHPDLDNADKSLVRLCSEAPTVNTSHPFKQRFGLGGCSSDLNNYERTPGEVRKFRSAFLGADVLYDPKSGQYSNWKVTTAVDSRAFTVTFTIVCKNGEDTCNPIKINNANLTSFRPRFFYLAVQSDEAGTVANGSPTNCHNFCKCSQMLLNIDAGGALRYKYTIPKVNRGSQTIQAQSVQVARYGDGTELCHNNWGKNQSKMMLIKLECPARYQNMYEKADQIVFPFDDNINLNNFLNCIKITPRGSDQSYIMYAFMSANMSINNNNVSTSYSHAWCPVQSLPFPST